MGRRLLGLPTVWTMFQLLVSVWYDGEIYGYGAGRQTARVLQLGHWSGMKEKRGWGKSKRLPFLFPFHLWLLSLCATHVE